MDILTGIGLFLLGFFLRMYLDYKAIKSARNKVRYVKFTENGAYLQGVGDGYVAGQRKKERLKTQVR